MPSPGALAPEAGATFDERLAILTEEIELAVKWQRPCMVLVVYSSEYVRADTRRPPLPALPPAVLSEAGARLILDVKVERVLGSSGSGSSSFQIEDCPPILP